MLYLQVSMGAPWVGRNRLGALFMNARPRGGTFAPKPERPGAGRVRCPTGKIGVLLINLGTLDAERHGCARRPGIGGRVPGLDRCQRLVGEAIPTEGRLLAVADAFDAMTSARPYRPALSVHAALAELDRCTGSQFDPLVARAFLAAWRAGEIATAEPLPAASGL